MTIPDSARAVLDGPGLAHLVTLDPDGAPQVSIVWIGLDGEGVKFPPMDEPPLGYITHITVERIGGVGPWAE